MCALRWAAMLALGALLAGCAAVPGLPDLAPVGGFALNGRVGVRYHGEGFSGGLRWVHDGQNDALDITSPLGQTVARVKQAPGFASLDDGQTLLTAADASALTEKALGWPLPVAGLPYWVRGEVRPGATEKEERDEAGRLVHLMQDDWDIRFENLPAQSKFPKRLVLSHGDVEIRLVVDRWADAPDAPGS